MLVLNLWLMAFGPRLLFCWTWSCNLYFCSRTTSSRVGVGCMSDDGFPPFFSLHDGITFECFELEGWNFVWGLIMEIFSKNGPMEKFQPPQPLYPPLKRTRWHNFYNFRPILMRFCMEVTDGEMQLKSTDWIAGPCLTTQPTHPKTT